MEAKQGFETWMHNGNCLADEQPVTCVLAAVAAALSHGGNVEVKRCGFLSSQEVSTQPARSEGVAN